jgi:hypothetical protein
MISAMHSAHLISFVDSEKTVYTLQKPETIEINKQYPSKILASS